MGDETSHSVNEEAIRTHEHLHVHDAIQKIQ